MTTNKVQYDGVVTATVKYTNAVDSDRIYDVSGEFQVQNKTVTNVQNGNAVRLSDSVSVASFSAWADDSLAATVNGVKDSTDKKEVFAAIVDFIDDVKAKVKNAD